MSEHMEQTGLQRQTSVHQLYHKDNRVEEEDIDISSIMVLSPSPVSSPRRKLSLTIENRINALTQAGESGTQIRELNNTRVNSPLGQILNDVEYKIFSHLSRLDKGKNHADSFSEHTSFYDYEQGKEIEDVSIVPHSFSAAVNGSVESSSISEITRPSSASYSPSVSSVLHVTIDDNVGLNSTMVSINLELSPKCDTQPNLNSLVNISVDSQEIELPPTSKLSPISPRLNGNQLLPVTYPLRGSMVGIDPEDHVLFINEPNEVFQEVSLADLENNDNTAQYYQEKQYESIGCMSYMFCLSVPISHLWDSMFSNNSSKSTTISTIVV